MKKIFSLIFLTIFFFSSIAHAEIETYTGKGEATMGESETLEKVIERAKQYAKQEAIEKAGVYIKSHSKTENFKLIEDEIISTKNFSAKRSKATRYTQGLILFSLQWLQ